MVAMNNSLYKLHSPKSWYSYSLSMPYSSCSLIKRTEDRAIPIDIA